MGEKMNLVFAFPKDIAAQWGGYDWGHGPGMMGGGYGFGWFGGIIMIAFWIAVIVGIVLLIRWLIISTRTPSHGTSSGESALEILKKRYARGEINKEEFEEKKRDLLS
jgi:putative membrane protein